MSASCQIRVNGGVRPKPPHRQSLNASSPRPKYPPGPGERLAHRTVQPRHVRDEPSVEVVNAARAVGAAGPSGLQREPEPRGPALRRVRSPSVGGRRNALVPRFPDRTDGGRGAVVAAVGEGDVDQGAPEHGRTCPVDAQADDRARHHLSGAVQCPQLGPVPFPLARPAQRGEQPLRGFTADELHGDLRRGLSRCQQPPNTWTVPAKVSILRKRLSGPGEGSFPGRGQEALYGEELPPEAARRSWGTGASRGGGAGATP